MRLPATPVRRTFRDLQTQIDDLSRAHHTTAMAVIELRRVTDEREEIAHTTAIAVIELTRVTDERKQVDLPGALSAALDLIVSLQAEFDDTRRRLVTQESQTSNAVAALKELEQRYAVLSRIIERQLVVSPAAVDGPESGMTVRDTPGASDHGLASPS